MITTMSTGNETISSVNDNFMTLARSYMMFKIGNIFDNLTEERIYSTHVTSLNKSPALNTYQGIQSFLCHSIRHWRFSRQLKFGESSDSVSL